jgi:hypothetical protein
MKITNQSTDEMALKDGNAGGLIEVAIATQVAIFMGVPFLSDQPIHDAPPGHIFRLRNIHKRE